MQPAAPALPLDVDVAHRLIREIIAGEHPPGAWLREAEIAERFAVSRSPVREALRHVAKAGFLEMHPWRGAQVIVMSRDEISDVFDVLEQIYGIVARGAARRMSADGLARLKALFKEGEPLSQPGASMMERVGWSFGVGRLIARYGAGRTTHDMIVQVGNLALWQHRFLASDDAYAARSLDLHRVLAGALEARDGETAALAARAIVSLGREAVMASLPLDEVSQARGAKRSRGAREGTGS